MIFDWAEILKSGGWSCGWLRICWCFFLFFPLSVFLLNVSVSFCEPFWAEIPYLFVLPLLNCEGFLVLVALVSGRCLQAISRSRSMCLMWFIRRSSLFAILRKIPPFVFCFFSHFVCHAAFKNICKEDVTAAVCEHISAESWFGSVWAFLFDAAWFERNNEGSRKGGIMRVITVVSWFHLCFCTARIQIFCHFTDN